MSKMLCDSNSVSLMSIDNSSSSIVSEPNKKISPVKRAVNSWWDEVEAAEHNVFEQEDAVNEVALQPIKCETSGTEQKIVVKMDPDMLTFSNKIKVIKEESAVVDRVNVKDEESTVVDGVKVRDEKSNRSNEVIKSNDLNKREIKLEFVDSSNDEKYDRLVREVKSKIPFKRRLSGDSRSNSPISFFPMENGYENNDAAEASKLNQYDQEDGATTSQTGSGTTGRGHGKRRRCNQEIETSAEILARRQKQIDYGKNTIGYDNYIQQIPRNKRTKDHPWTPPKQFKYSRRAFDGLIKVWRTKLHCFDNATNDADGSSESDDVK
ncbi:histone RNA hairpin-binding protein-like [Bradysia coprophila]|uniref:histone RNA hairpin-binding protein-like n=1 Tax=Bradysia coprophila TaxID=38358 RepID=UPI00187D99FD|nr:histone RNA hairpin-binding protein-like [Bradysia coprophila]